MIMQALGDTIRQLKSLGLTIVLLEQNFRFAAPLAGRHYIIEYSEVVETIEASEIETKKNASTSI